MKKRVLACFLVIILVLGVAIGCNPKENANKKSQEDIKNENYVPVEVDVALIRTISNDITFSGAVYPNKSVMVLPKSIGKVSVVNVQTGDRVKKGDILFVLDKDDIKKQVDQAKAAYDAASANYNMTKDQLEVANASLERTKVLVEDKLSNARKSFDRTKELYEEGAVSQAQYEQAEINLKDQESMLKSQLEQSELAASNNSLNAAKASLDQARIGYNQALDALENASVDAPISGTVTEISIEEGEFATNTQPAMTIVDTDVVYVQINVTENIINELYKGKEVTATIPSATDQSLTGKIDDISPTPDARTQLYPVKIYIENEDGLIKSGMFAEIKVQTDIRKSVVAVKSEAVIDEEGKDVVFVAEDGKAVAKEVKVGLDTGEYVEIIDGLKGREKVIVKGQNYVEDGTIVKVVRGDK